MDDRLALQGILFVLHTGIAWEHLPQELGYGSGMTCWRRLAEWNPNTGIKAVAAGAHGHTENELRYVLLPRIKRINKVKRRFTRNASHPTYAAMLEVGRGGSVAVNHGWSRGAHVHKDGLWTVDELADQLKDLPMDDPFNKLSDALGGALGHTGHTQLQQMINALLDRSDPRNASS